ncbi:MAG: hypothetical protein ACTSUV_03350 [Candidatus Ranarchaeia archaeon]
MKEGKKFCNDINAIPLIHKKIIGKNEKIKFGETCSKIKYKLAPKTSHYLVLGVLAPYFNIQKKEGTAYLTDSRFLFVKNIDKKKDKVSKKTQDQIKLRKHLEYSFPYEYVLEVEIVPKRKKEILVTTVLIEEKLYKINWEIDETRKWFSESLKYLKKFHKEYVKINELKYSTIPPPEKKK